MQKESNPDILLAQSTELLSEHLGQQHEMIVVDPDHVTIICFASNGQGKLVIGFSVCIPRGLVKDDFTGVVVQQRP